MKLALTIGIAFIGQMSLTDREAALQRARESIVGEFDPALPNISFDSWLSSLAVPGSEVEWSLNDCGEQTGNPQVDRNREIPMCAEGHVALRDGRELSVLLSIGTWQGGISDRAPRFSFAYLREGEETLGLLLTLAEVVSAVRGP